MTLVRWSPWAASMNRNTWISLRNARPSDRPPSAPGMFGNAPNGGIAMPKLEFLIGMSRSDVRVFAGVRPDRKLPVEPEMSLTKVGGLNWPDVKNGSERIVA